MKEIKQLTELQATVFYKSKVYENWTADQVARFQLFQDRLALPFSLFQKSMSEVLKRPVFTHEFGYRDEITNEYLGQNPPPTLEDIFHLIPEDKRFILSL